MAHFCSFLPKKWRLPPLKTAFFVKNPINNVKLTQIPPKMSPFWHFLGQNMTFAPLFAPFLTQTPLFFAILSKNSPIFAKLEALKFENGKNRQNRPFWTHLARFWPFWAHFRPFWALFGPFWVILDPFGSISTILDPFWVILDPFWVILGHFEPFWTKSSSI